MNCPECGHELTPEQEIKALKKKIAKLEGELAAERAKPLPIIPWPEPEPCRKRWGTSDPFPDWQIGGTYVDPHTDLRFWTC